MNPAFLEEKNSFKFYTTGRLVPSRIGLFTDLLLNYNTADVHILFFLNNFQQLIQHEQLKVQTHFKLHCIGICHTRKSFDQKKNHTKFLAPFLLFVKNTSNLSKPFFLLLQCIFEYSTCYELNNVTLALVRLFFYFFVSISN